MIGWLFVCICCSRMANVQQCARAVMEAGVSGPLSLIVLRWMTYAWECMRFAQRVPIPKWSNAVVMIESLQKALRMNDSFSRQSGSHRFCRLLVAQFFYLSVLLFAVTSSVDLQAKYVDRSSFFFLFLSLFALAGVECCGVCGCVWHAHTTHARSPSREKTISNFLFIVTTDKYYANCI